jgi:hypothetical protein
MTSGKLREDHQLKREAIPFEPADLPPKNWSSSFDTFYRKSIILRLSQKCGVVGVLRILRPFYAKPLQIQEFFLYYAPFNPTAAYNISTGNHHFS